MKIALVHELLTMRGGAERVLRILADLFPDAPIYTLLYDEKKLGDWFPKERIRTSPLQSSLTTRYSLLTTHSINHHLYLRRFPKAVESWDFSQFDLVISTSSAFAHGIITNSNPKHLCYVHSPARYLWDRTHDVMREASKGPLGMLKKLYLTRTFHTLRIWDSEAGDRPNKLLAASKAVQRRIEMYWRRTSDVVTPPIDDFWFSPPNPNPIPACAPAGASVGRPHPYFLVVSSLVRYKRIDLAIQACTKLGQHLKIVGEGPDRKRLQKLAGPTVEFYGWRQGDELKDLYASAIATIFPGDEDFGLVPLESMACGTPVIAYRSGGALESIVEGSTGEFFDDPTSDSLQEIIKKFEPQNQSASGARFGAPQKKYSSDACREQAKKFSKEKFIAEISNAIAELMQPEKKTQ